MNNSEICVGVTSLKTIGSPQPGFGVARSLKECGYTVIGIDDTQLTSAICAPYFDKVYTVKSLGNENFEEFILELKKIKKETGLSILIPCYDREVFFFNKYKKEITDLGIQLLMPSIDTLKITSKPFMQILEKNGINVPKTICVKTKESLLESVKELGFPIVCKGVLKDAYFVTDLPDALLFFDKIRELWHGGKGNVLVQEFIPGNFYCVSGVTDKNSNIHRFIQMKKLGIDSKGTTWSGFSIKNKKLLEISKKIIKASNWIGPFEFEFIKHLETNEYYLFDVNPRPSAWVYFSTVAGQNIPEAVVQILLEDPKKIQIKPLFSYKENLAFTRIAEEVIFDKKYLDELKTNGKLPKQIKNIGGLIRL